MVPPHPSEPLNRSLSRQSRHQYHGVKDYSFFFLAALPICRSLLLKYPLFVLHSHMEARYPNYYLPESGSVPFIISYKATLHNSRGGVAYGY